MEKHILFFDIDGTILYHGRDFPFSVVRAIKRAQKEGHYVVINTGRPRVNIPKKILRRVKWDGFICAGAYVEFLGEKIGSSLMPRESVEKLVEIVTKDDIPVVFDCEGPSYSYRVKYGIHLSSPKDIFIDFENKRVNKLEIMKNLSPEVMNSIAPYASPYHMGTYVDVFVHGCSKASGMEIIGKKTGTPRERMIAFGDNNNDLDMFGYAGKSVAMKQASPDAVKASTYHATKYRLGVKQGLEKYLNIK